jgi:hypothetical protein
LTRRSGGSAGINNDQYLTYMGHRAGLGANFANCSGDGSRNFHNRFIRLNLQHRLIQGYRITRLNQPAQNLGLMDPLANIG